MSVDEQHLLDLVQHLEFQVLWHFSLEQIEAPSVDRSHIHLCKPDYSTKLISTPRKNSFFEFGCDLILKRESDNVPWDESLLEEISNSARYNFCFP